jgi:dienelactone hydrolase
MKRSLGIALLILPLAAGCTGGKSGSNPVCGFQHGGTGGATAQYHADTSCFTNPFPDDVLRGGSGTPVIPASRFSYVLPDTSDFAQARTYLQTIADGLDADGFSTIAPALISLDHAVDPATAANGIRLFVFDTAQNAAPDSHTFTATWDADLSDLVVQPDLPLLPSTTYGIVVTADLLDTNGRPTVASRDFVKSQQTPTAPVATLLAAANAAGITTDRIALAFAFTTQTESDDLVKIRDLVFGAGTLGSSLEPSIQVSDPALPGIEEGYFLSGTTGFNDNVGVTASSNMGAVLTGAIDSYDFRGSGVAFQAPLLNGTQTPPANHFPFRVTFPKTAPLPGGYPLVIYQHGLGGSDADVYEWGQKLAPRGYAVVAIPAVQHGRRGDVIDFFNWDSMPGTRESFRQTNADQMQLVRMLRNARAAGTPPFDTLNVDDITYFGISLGGILGSAPLSLIPGMPRGLLVVPGGHLSDELFAAKVAGAYLWPFISERAGIDPLAQPDEWNRFLKAFQNLVQIGLDRGDPVNYAVHTVTPGAQFPGVTPKRVLMLESLGDNWVPNVANEALRRALGIPILTTPATDAGGLSGTWVYSAADFPQVGTAEPHGYFGILCQEQEQGFHWIDSGGTDVIDPLSVTCN